jgi:hypothetical protein
MKLPWLTIRRPCDATTRASHACLPCSFLRAFETLKLEFSSPKGPVSPWLQARPKGSHSHDQPRPSKTRQTKLIAAIATIRNSTVEISRATSHFSPSGRFTYCPITSWGRFLGVAMLNISPTRYNQGVTDALPETD